MKISRGKLTLALLLILLLQLSTAIAGSILMPGKSFNGRLAPLSSVQMQAENRLRQDLKILTCSIGERHWERPGSLEKAAAFITTQLKSAAGSRGSVHREEFNYGGQVFKNIVMELPGTDKRDEIVVVGAHYDSVKGCPGADDNGSGTVALLELARALANKPHSRTIRLVAFPNEEYFFRSEGMGSYQYAFNCKNKREKITAMLALETIGYYKDTKGSQSYPPPLNAIYPDTGNFIAFIANSENAGLVRRCLNAFRTKTLFPSEGISAPQAVPGIDWSDQLYFWQMGYPGIMISDTAIYRNPNYHKSSDTIDTIDFDRMVRVVDGIRECIIDLADN